MFSVATLYFKKMLNGFHLAVFTVVLFYNFTLSLPIYYYLKFKILSPTSIFVLVTKRN